MSRRRKTLVRFLEFFVIGLVFGIGEDLLAIKLTTESAITPAMIGITFLVAFPFAIFSELVVDHPNFWHKLKLLKHDEEDHEK